MPLCLSATSLLYHISFHLSTPFQKFFEKFYLFFLEVVVSNFISISHSLSFVKYFLESFFRTLFSFCLWYSFIISLLYGFVKCFSGFFSIPLFFRSSITYCPLRQLIYYITSFTLCQLFFAASAFFIVFCNFCALYCAGWRKAATISPFLYIIEWPFVQAERSLLLFFSFSFWEKFLTYSTDRA